LATQFFVVYLGRAAGHLAEKNSEKRTNFGRARLAFAPRAFLQFFHRDAPITHPGRIPEQRTKAKDNEKSKL
jgi:hypothetical protein